MNVDTDWHYRLFFSVDIENSTAYKYSKISKNINETTKADVLDWLWGIEFKEFVTFFSDEFQKNNEKYTSDTKDLAISYKDIEIWKLLGDEIIFVVEIKDVRAVLWHVLAFRRTIANYNGRKLIKNKANFKCKGTIWGAGFPLNNFPLQGLSSNETLDNRFLKQRNQLLEHEYIGANIDAGFRLAKFATPRKLIISIEIAYFLSKAWSVQETLDVATDMSFPEIIYEGRHILKGIFNNNAYPVFSLDLRFDACESEDKWLKNNNYCTCKELLEFCEYFFEKDLFFSKPFVFNDVAEICDEVPPEMSEKRSTIISLLETNKQDEEEGTNIPNDDSENLKLVK